MLREMVADDMEKINESLVGIKNTMRTEILKRVVNEECTDSSI